MTTYLIERSIPGAEALSADELRVISQKSNGVLTTLENITWLHSYVLDERIYCVYEASGPAVIEEHARCMGIPANAIRQIHRIISPATANP